MYLQLDSDDIKIYYEAIGDGIPVVIIHGFYPDHRLMKGCLEPVFQNNPGFRRYYFDLPGMGKTVAAGKIESSDAIFSAVLEFILKILGDSERFLVIGESYGGYLTRALISKMTQRIRGMMLLCPVIFPDPLKRELPQHAIFKCDEKSVENLCGSDKSRFCNDMVIQDARTISRFKEEILPGVNAADAETLERIWQSSYGFSFNVDEISGLDAPSLIITGKNDHIVGYRDAYRELLKIYPRATYAALDMAGHYLQIERPSLFEALVADWLARVVEKPESHL